MRTQHLIHNFRQIFDGRPWLGPANLQMFFDLSPDQFNMRLGSGNSVAGLLAHTVVWRQYGIEKLKGRADFRIQMDTIEDWPLPGQVSVADYQLYLQKLSETQTELIHLLEQKTDDQWLDETVPGTKFNFAYLIEGILQHDIYHLGQIAMLLTYHKKQS